MKTLWIGVITVTFLNSWCLSAIGAELYPFYRGIRGQGMGGAAVAVVDDETSLFLNPAGLGKVRGPYFDLANIELETNYATQSAFSIGGNYTSITNPQTLLNVAQANPNQPLHTLIQSTPSFVTTNFGFGALAKYSLDAQYNPSTNIMNATYYNDYAAVIGYCFRLWEGRIKVGVSGKIDNRVYMNQNIAGNTNNLNMGNLVSEGTGAGWDGSVMLTAPVKYLPTITAVAHDIGNTNFTLGGGYFFKPGVTPPPQAQSVDVGLALFPILSHGNRMTLTVEYRNLANPETVDPWRAIHAGIEFNFSDTVFLRGGLNQHYPTVGLEWDLGPSQLQLAMYGEDIGTPTTPQEDNRFLAEYGFRF